MPEIQRTKKFSRQIIFSALFAMSIIFLAVITTPRSAKALSIFTFGGLHTVSSPCTCPSSAGNFLLYIYDYKTKSPMALVYSPEVSKLYSDYNFMEGTYMEGSYTPGAGAALCLEAGDPCTPMPSDGLIDSFPGFGTSPGV